MSQNSIFNPLANADQADPVRNISSIDPKLSRTNYYDGRLLKASDLIRDQLYLDERLREVGRAIGYGIVRGLKLALNDEGQLSLSPGLGVTPSGRVLELEDSALSLNLYDSALIAALNPGFRRLERGLYAVLIQYAEMGEGSAEIYPRDLEGERGFHFNAYAEGVEITLAPLRMRTPLIRNDSTERLRASVAARAALVRELIGSDEPLKDIAEDGLALGLLSIENGRPQWLDQGLLRRPHRKPNAPNRLQQDLHTHYQELLGDILQMRRQSVRQQAFPAAHYFSLLPPYGSVPRDSVNPEEGRQSFFPEGFDVSIAPVRQDDLDAILSQSAALEPIDLNKDKDVDIMLLVPMSDYQFSWRARQLEHEASGDSKHTRLAHLDNLALRLYERPNVHQTNTDAAVWRAIWAETQDLVFVRRPTRVAETQISAVVLAAGYGKPEPGSSPPADHEGIEAERMRLEARIQELEERIAELEDALDDSVDERLAEAQTRIASLESEIAALNLQLADAANDRDTIAQLTSERDQLRSDLDAALAEIEELRNSDNDQQVAQLQAELTNVREALEAANRTIEELRARGGGDLMSVRELLELRGVREQRTVEAALELEDLISDDRQRLRAINQAAALFSRDYDLLLWVSLLDVAQNRSLADFIEVVSREIENTPVEQIVAVNGSNLGIGDELIELWQNFEARRRDGLRTPDIGSIDRISRLDNVSVSPVNELASNRGFNDTNLLNTFSNEIENQDNLRLINQIASLVDPRYEQALWATLPALNRNGNLEEFRDYLVASIRAGLPLGTAIAARSNTLRISTRQRALWADADLRM